jgi:hypothetical protein
MLASDFLTVVWLTRNCFIFLVLLERRRIEFVASTANPNGGLVAQRARNLLMLLHDRRRKRGARARGGRLPQSLTRR